MVWQFHVQDHSDEGGPEGAAENDRRNSERAHRGYPSSSDVLARGWAGPSLLAIILFEKFV
jgi:hypothetical protein